MNASFNIGTFLIHFSQNLFNYRNVHISCAKFNRAEEFISEETLAKVACPARERKTGVLKILKNS